jgi:hypothetical protein
MKKYIIITIFRQTRWSITFFVYFFRTKYFCSIFEIVTSKSRPNFQIVFNWAQLFNTPIGLHSVYLRTGTVVYSVHPVSLNRNFFSYTHTITCCQVVVAWSCWLRIVCSIHFMSNIQSKVHETNGNGLITARAANATRNECYCYSNKYFYYKRLARVLDLRIVLRIT